MPSKLIWFCALVVASASQSLCSSDAESTKDTSSSPSTPLTFQPTDFTDFSAETDTFYRTVIDLEKYPIDDLDGEACQKIITHSQERLRARGSIDFPGFVRASVIAQMAQEVSQLPAHHRLQSSPYMIHPQITEVGEHHPLRKSFQMSIFAASGVDISADTLLRRGVYNSPAVARFMARVMNVPLLYQNQDEFQKLNVHYQFDADQRKWHYDGTDFTVTLMLQQGNSGGEFEWAPNIRGQKRADGTFDERFDDVASLFNGSYTGEVLISRVEPGTLNVFNGERTLHRVRSVYGYRKRSIAILTYDTRPPCEQSAPAVQLNVNSYGERVRTLYEEHRAARQSVCGAPKVAEFEG